MSEWFDRAFGEGYDAFYPHRDRHDAAADVERVLAAAPDTDAPTLDLCCGNGRHLALLAERGFQKLVGLDRSDYLLARARARVPQGRLVRGDLRALPFADARFNLVLNLFTSFGYFATDAEHAQALREVRRVLRHGGRLHIDHIDRAWLVANLQPRSEETRDGLTLVAERQLVGNRVEKRLRSSNGQIDHFERVRLWSPEELETLLHATGFASVQITLTASRMHVWAQ